MSGFEFQDPVFLWLIALVPLAFLLGRRSERGLVVFFSDISLARGLPRTRRAALSGLPALLAALALVLAGLGLARPRLGLSEVRVSSEGVAIVIALDVSGSMEAEDFQAGGRRINRLDISKQVIEQFIRGRDSDRIGLVVFATHAYTQCPLTIDYEVLQMLLAEVKLGILDGQRTAIGSALAASLNRLRDAEAKSKVVILVTDGNNNAGKIDPLTAAEMAKTLGVKIYAIGVGGKDPYRYRGAFGQIYTVEPLNDQPLMEISDLTGGKYFRATDSGALESIFATIDRLEKTVSEDVIYTSYRELFPAFVWAALGLLLLGFLLERTVFRRLP